MVCVDFTNMAIGVDTQWFTFDSLSIDIIKDSLPENVKNKTVFFINWWLNDSTQTSFGLSDYSSIIFENNEENYNKWVKPYVDIWQIKKDEEAQQQEAVIAEQDKFENRQARALEQLNQDFQIAADRAHVVSSLGFTADANSTANENVNGLLITIGDGTVQFCDYYNEFHALNKAQLETLRSEIIQNGQNLYAQKWQYRTAIEDCVDNEGLDAVVATIEFTYMDFSTAS